MKTSNKKYFALGLMIVLLFVLTGCGSTNTDPIKEFSGPLDILVWPMAGLMWIIGKTIAFGNYGLVIIITTIIVRTLGWPIYAKTNDLSLKMQLLQPELSKIEEKYADRTEPDAQQRKQMETMQLYKKYGVGLGGCLMPILQFPLFIAFFETLRRVPETIDTSLKMNFAFLKTNFTGMDLFLTANEGGTSQKWGVYVLAGLVAITQILSQILLSQRQKKQQEEQMASVPEYRRPKQTDQQKQTQLSMKIMMYGMSVMMVVFVINNTAALGLYWLVGNIYSTIQGVVSHKKSKGRLETLRSKY